jgi:hypothetical protein
MTRYENHSQADSSPFDRSLEPLSRLLKYGLTRSCHQTNCPARPSSLKGTGQAGTEVYSVLKPGACW